MTRFDLRRTSRTRRIAALVSGLCLALAPLAARADVSARTVNADPKAALGAADIAREGDTMKLSLEDAITIALSRNLGLHVQKFLRAETYRGIEQAKGIYDFNLGAALDSSDSQSPAASNLAGATVIRQKQQDLSLNLSQLVPSGGTAAFSFTNTRLETNSSFYTLNPSYTTGATFSFTQPLLQNFGRAATEIGIEVAKLSGEQSDAAFREQVISTVQSVVTDYWNLVNAREQYRVAEEDLALAKQLHEQNQVRVKVGTLAPLELVSSEAGIATREEAIITAQAAIGDAEDALRALLNLDQGEAWEAHIEPTTQPSDEPVNVDVNDAIRTALADRPEIVAQRLANQSLALNAKFFHQALKPRLDLKATYGWNGLGGRVLVRDDQGNVVSEIPGGYSDSLQQVTNLDYPGWTVGLQLGIPIQNRTARAKSAIADLQLEQGKSTLDQLEQGIAVDVRAAVRALRTARQQIDSSAVASKLAEKNLDAEQKKYQNGLSTSFNVLQVQEQLTVARQSEVSAHTAFNKAISDYYRAIGKLLDQEAVEIRQ